MPAGTIALTNNSATVTGTGTSFNTELKVNDFLVSTVGGGAYTLGVKSIESNTSLTLIEKYTGPAATGQSWTPVPYGTMAAITAQLAAQVTYAIRGFNLDKANWQQVFTGTGTITVNLPDGTSWQGPAWSGISATLNNKASKGNNSDITSLSGLTTALSIDQGGTGQKTASLAWKALLDGRTATTARNDLGLGSAATLDYGSANGNAQRVNSFVLGSVVDGAALSSVALGANEQTGLGYWDASGGGVMPGLWQVGINIKAGGAVGGQLVWTGYTNSPRMILRSRNTAATGWASAEFYTTANTTKASDGTLKAASPIARIVAAKETTQRTDVDEAGFSWCGCGTANEEAEGISISRLETGVYVLTGSAGLAIEGWQLLPPCDPQGSGDMGIVEAEQTDSGGLIIRLYKRRYKLSDDGDIEIVKGALIDVPAVSWIDVRLDMPEDSPFKRKQAVMEQ